MLWGVQEGGHRYGRVEHQALVDSCDLALPQRHDFGLPLSDGRREDGAIVGLSPGQRSGKPKHKGLRFSPSDSFGCLPHGFRSLLAHPSDRKE